MNEDDKIYADFVNIMFEEWDADEMAYLHLTVMEEE